MIVKSSFVISSRHVIFSFCFTATISKGNHKKEKMKQKKGDDLRFDLSYSDIPHLSLYNKRMRRRYDQDWWKWAARDKRIEKDGKNSFKIEKFFLKQNLLFFWSQKRMRMFYFFPFYFFSCFCCCVWYSSSQKEILRDEKEKRFLQQEQKTTNEKIMRRQTTTKRRSKTQRNKTQNNDSISYPTGGREEGEREIWTLACQKKEKTKRCDSCWKHLSTTFFLL